MTPIVTMPPLTAGHEEAESWHRGQYGNLMCTLWRETFMLALRNWILLPEAEANDAERVLLEDDLGPVWRHGVLAYLARRATGDRAFAERVQHAYDAYEGVLRQDEATREAAVAAALNG